MPWGLRGTELTVLCNRGPIILQPTPHARSSTVDSKAVVQGAERMAIQTLPSATGWANLSIFCSLSSEKTLQEWEVCSNSVSPCRPCYSTHVYLSGFDIHLPYKAEFKATTYFSNENIRKKRGFLTKLNLTLSSEGCEKKVKTVLLTNSLELSPSWEATSRSATQEFQTLIPWTKY
jgi:hypothetical protein